ncbi:MAG: hypothetical protein R6X16_00850 [Anaerolineae bacterium]
MSKLALHRVSYLFMLVLALATIAGGLAGCQASTETDPLVVPGAVPLESTESGQEYFLTALQSTEQYPAGIPAATPASFVFTREAPLKVREHYAAALPAAGWSLSHDWMGNGIYQSSWQKDQSNLVVVHTDALTDDQLSFFRQTFELGNPDVTDADVALIVTYMWEAGE